MPTRSIHDSITDRSGSRLRVNVDRSSGEIEYPYSSGATIVTRPSSGPIYSSGGRLISKGTKEVIRATGPHSIWMNESRNDVYRTNFDRIFRKGKEGHSG